MSAKENEYVTIEELKLLMKQVFKTLDESAQQIKENERLMNESNQQMKESNQEFDRKFDRLFGKYDKLFGKVGELDRNWGKLVEALVEPSLTAQFKNRGIPVDGSSRRVKKKKGGQQLEIDILLDCDDVIIAVEVKTTLSVQDINEHIDKHLKPFKEFFPEHKHKKLYGAVAYINVDENADRYAYKQGLFVLGFAENDMVEIKNDDQFIPKTY